jgi:NAD(P)-dependent dehydrogenase (short-subunit alcohol dehydrogenase family)
MPNKRLQDKVIIITGASSGFGRAASLRFAKEGARIIAADINVSGGEELVALVKAQGGELIFVKPMLRILRIAKT